jgi:hypothetical protein
MTWPGFVFVTSLVSLVYFLRACLRVWGSPEYKAEAKMLREQRRIRKASNRRPM